MIRKLLARSETIKASEYKGAPIILGVVIDMVSPYGHESTGFYTKSLLWHRVLPRMKELVEDYELRTHFLYGS